MLLLEKSFLGQDISTCHKGHFRFSEVEAKADAKADIAAVASTGAANGTEADTEADLVSFAALVLACERGSTLTLNNSKRIYPFDFKFGGSIKWIKGYLICLKCWLLVSLQCL